MGLEGGPRYHFGEVRLEQNVLDEDFLQRYIPFRSGDPYSLDQVIALQRALHDSNYFQIAQVSPGKPDRESREVPVEVLLTPRKQHRYDFGVGYGTDTGARARFGWRMPRVNRRGHRIDSHIEVSEIGYNVGANYRIPVLNPRTDQLVYSINKEKEETDSNDSVISLIGVSLNHNRGDWRETLALNYQLEEFSVADESGDSTLLIPSVAWSRTWGSDFINVLDGLRFDIGIRGASENLASDTDFAQLRGGLKFIYSFDNRNRVLMRGGFGTTETPNFERLPSSIRFFAGGSQSVRGYAYESLGPENEDGDVLGGRHLLTGSVEYEHYFDDKWGLAVFLDAGNAIDNLNDDLEQGAGFGLRWKSPVGPVRIDLANAISTDQGWRLHISIGPDL
jgi:translocation and assembly module TamA